VLNTRHAGDTDPSYTCHPDDGTASPSSFSQILDDRLDDESPALTRRLARRRVVFYPDRQRGMVRVSIRI